MKFDRTLPRREHAIVVRVLQGGREGGGRGEKGERGGEQRGERERERRERGRRERGGRGEGGGKGAYRERQDDIAATSDQPMCMLCMPHRNYTETLC